MNKVWMALLATAVGGSAFAQNAVLYQPARTAKDQGLTIRSWGSGTISETDETAYQGTNSIRISTHNFFQGGILKFGTPVDLTKEYNSKTNLLKIAFKLADSGVVSGGGGLKGPGGPRGGGGIGGPPGGSFPGQGNGGGNRGGGPGQGGGFGPPGGGTFGGQRGGGQGNASPGGKGFGGGSSSVTAPELKTFRLIVTTTDGMKSEVYVPTDTSTAGENGWKTLAIPLQAITGLDRTNKTIQSIGIGGNTIATFYVGDLRIIDDSTPIRGEIVPNPSEINLALGDEYTFSASGFGGASILRYTWDFDNKDGIQVDAEGQAVNRKFRKAGTYVVTMTVSDYYGLKPAYSTTIKVTVNP